MKAKSAFYIFGNIFYTYLGIIKDTQRNFPISLFHVILGRRQEDVTFFEFRGTVHSSWTRTNTRQFAFCSAILKFKR